MYQVTNGQTYAHSQTKCCVASAYDLLVQLQTILVYILIQDISLLQWSNPALAQDTTSLK